MDKRNLIALVHERSSFTKHEVRTVSDSLLESIIEALQRGETVKLSNFGKFELKVSKARNIIHPKTKQQIRIPEKVNVVFSVSTRFKTQEGVMEKLNMRDNTIE